MTASRLSPEHHAELLSLLYEKYLECTSLRREIDAMQPYMLWMADRIHYLETALENSNES